jgi:hypothetical protein
MATKPMCPNPVWCAGVGDERHRAQFRHQCPFGKSCQDQANPKHLEEFAHDKFFTETRTVNPASPMINSHPSSNGASYGGVGGPIAQGVVVQQPYQQPVGGAGTNNSFTVTSQPQQQTVEGKGAAPTPYPSSGAMPPPMMMGPYPTHGMWMPTASPYAPAPVSLMPGAYSSPIYPVSQAPSTAMAMPYSMAPVNATSYSQGGGSTQPTTSQAAPTAQPPYPGFFLSKNIPAPAGSSQMNRPKPAS